jgi:hypothetical protein
MLRRRETARFSIQDDYCVVAFQKGKDIGKRRRQFLAVGPPFFHEVRHDFAVGF